MLRQFLRELCTVKCGKVVILCAIHAFVISLGVTLLEWGYATVYLARYTTLVMITNQTGYYYVLQKSRSAHNSVMVAFVSSKHLLYV